MYQALFDKYARPPQPIEVSGSAHLQPVPEPEPKPASEPLQPEAVKTFDTARDAWKQFPKVVLLSEYLRENRDMGIRLVLLDGRPTLHFSPGLDEATSPERLAVMGQAFDLLFDALADLEYLIGIGQHVVPNHPGFCGGC